jgi:hypothetical protein
VVGMGIGISRTSYNIEFKNLKQIYCIDVKILVTSNVKNIKHSLDELQKLVGGHIEALYPFNDTAVIICNDEGKINGLPLNRGITHPETGELYEIIAGNFFICDAPPDSDDLASLSDKQIKVYMERFKYPESFIMEDGKITVIKCIDN